MTNANENFRRLVNTLILLFGVCLTLLNFPIQAQTRALLESPSANAFVRSGVGLIRGWACEAKRIEISINGGPRLSAGYGTLRTDTASVCGDSHNGFGLTYNWNSIGDGVHRIQAFMDGVEFANVSFTVTTLGQDFITGLAKNYLLPNFPIAGQFTPVRWSEPHQNFVIAQSTPVPTPPNPLPPAPRAYLESPNQGSFESGVGLIRGWVCEAARVEISLNSGPRLSTAYGTPRSDTQGVCGDHNNGFGLTVNWGSLGDGVHHVQAFADGVEFARVNFAVTTLGVDFLTGLDRKVFALGDFPNTGEATTLRWSESDQNFTLAQTTATPPKLAMVSVITDLHNAFTVAGAGTGSTDATGVRADKNAQGQPTQLQGVAWTDAQTGQAADIQLTANGLPATYTDSAGVEARFNAFTETTATVSFHGRSGNVQAGPVAVPIDSSPILALQEMARRVFNAARSPATPVGGQQLADSPPIASDLVRSTTATAEQVFTLSQLLVNVYWYGSQATGELICAVERAGVAAGVGGSPIASTACQSPLIAALRSRLNARQGQLAIPDIGIDPIVQQSLRFDDDVVEAPCDPATDSAACLIAPTVQLQERQQEVPTPLPPEPEEPVLMIVTATAGPGGTITPTTQTVNAGATARFTVAPNSGYQIAAVTGCGGNLSGVTYTTGPITAACTVSASFTTEQTYVLTLNTAGTGTGTVSGAGSYTNGAAVALTAIPNADSTLVGWSPAPCAASFTMPAQDLTCTATFSRNAYVVTATAGPGGAITPATQTVDAGATARFTVTPDRGYAIAAVTGCNGSLSGAIYTTAPITAACTVSARFDAITVIVTLDGSLTAQVGMPYRGLLQATGGTSPYGWAVLSGSLPPGMTLTTEGTLSGTPTTAGSYSFSVQATDRNGATGTGVFTITVARAAVPHPPAGVSASDGAYTDRIQVTWNAVTGATYYEAYTFNDGPAYLLGQSASANFNDTSATPGSPRLYLVKACNEAGCSAFSDSDSGYVRLSAPNATVQCTVRDVVCVVAPCPALFSTDVSWNSVPGQVAEYQIYQNGLLRNTTSGTSFSLLGQITGVQVKACNSHTGCSDYSNVVGCP